MNHPTLAFVSVESGIGWVPFVLEAADHQFTGPGRGLAPMGDLLPSDLSPSERVVQLLV